MKRRFLSFISNYQTLPISDDQQEKLSHQDKMSEATSLQKYAVFRDRPDDLLAQS